MGVKAKVMHDDPYTLRPSDVAGEVTKEIKRKFTTSGHSQCWKYYSVRGTYGEGKAKCNPKYCDYKEKLNYFMYTQEWVDFLISELSDPHKYNEVILTKHIDKSNLSKIP